MMKRLQVSDFTKRLRQIVFSIVLLIAQLISHASLCFGLTVKLIDFLRRGTRTWIVMLARLLAFTVVLTPGWIRLMHYWMFDPHVIKNIAYSDKPSTSRNHLDLYLPPDFVKLPRKKYPVIVFVSGGAWIIGYKMWSALVARGLSRLGSVVLCPDYRNAPQGDIECMMDDIASAVKWTIQHVEEYGGDADNIVLAGQSAGAHISTCLLVDSFSKEVWTSSHLRDDGKNECSRLSKRELGHIKLLVGVSGPYNLRVLARHLHGRGLDTSILSWICKNNVDKYSPSILLRQLRESNQIRQNRIKFPPVALFHGSCDASVPSDISKELGEVMFLCGFDVDVKIYSGFSHTDLIVEGPLMGENELLHDITRVIHSQEINALMGGCDSMKEKLASAGRTNGLKGQVDDALVPRWLVKTARKLNPF